MMIYSENKIPHFQVFFTKGHLRNGHYLKTTTFRISTSLSCPVIYVNLHV